MNRHQVLTGAANSGDHCYAVGSVEGVSFTAYAAGCDIVILTGDFQRIQIIPGAVHGYIQVSCIDCCSDTGKIVASYGRKVCVFEPTPLLHQQSEHHLDYRWYHTGTIETSCQVLALSLNQEGSKLLTAGEQIQLWQSPDQTAVAEDNANVEFFLEEHDDLLEWSCIWRCQTATPVTLIRFSPDGLLFASVGKNDRLVKIWYENKRVQLPLIHTDSLSPKKEEFNYSFVYVAHPHSVTGFTWRKTSRYMPRGSVANMLITSCRDNICRIWCETILPEDGLVDVYQLDPAAAQNPMYHTQRHKKRFMHRLHHIRHIVHKRKHHGMFNAGPVGSTGASSLPSLQSVHDFHKFGIHPNSVAPGFHFHLAASINADSDIPLLPALGTTESASDPNFVVHWLNNKEFHFTQEAEKIIREMTRKAHIQEDPDSSTDPGDTNTETENEEVPDTGTGDSSGSQTQSNSKHASEHMKKKRSFLRKSHSLLSTESERSTMSVTSTTSTVTHSSDGNTVTENIKGLTTDPLDHKIEILLHDWHQSADMLFSVHPIDGSFLVWLVDWLDEPSPGSFRQVQISFSSRIPQAIPLGDAMSMSPDLLLYCNYNQLHYRDILKEAGTPSSAKNSSSSAPKMHANAMGKNSPGQNNSNTLSPNVLMISKHNNGSLNQWQISFAEGSHFSTVLNISHASRVCGHRFQTNSATCHPVLPLLVTTSHHNIPDTVEDEDEMDIHTGHRCPDAPPGDFCSELILWKVDPVGWLSKSGGVTELARINCPHISAFTSVSWLPTLLPCSTLGTLSNSPSALFVASDGTSLRVYQAVLDARTLLAEVTGQRRKQMISLSCSSSSTSSGFMLHTPSTPTPTKESLNIVSLQSSSRPGAILELDAIADAKQDWQHIQLIHVFQEQLICGSGLSTAPTDSRPTVDLQNSKVFEETFFLVVLEKVVGGSSVLHMWKLVISSNEKDSGPIYTADVDFYQDSDGETPMSSRSNTPEPPGENQSSRCGSHISIHSQKVCTQSLDLPEDVTVIWATVTAGHLSSSSIYPACCAPYLISTACSDGRVRFWTCKRTVSCDEDNAEKYTWSEWEVIVGKSKHSSIRVPGKPLMISCAYSGRVAVAYRQGAIKNKEDDPDKKYVNLYVSIYECESTGGSEWVLEDTIELKNITIPDPKIEIDLTRIYDDHSNGYHDNGETVHGQHTSSHVILSSTHSTPAIVKTVNIPSITTVKSIKHMMSQKGSKADILKPRHLVQLDWVSMEDGSHILTVGVGSKLLLYAAVSSEISQATIKDTRSTKNSNPTRILQKSKSMTVQNFVDEIRWMRLRSMDLQSADGLPPLPVHISWVRDGILVVSMDNEMHVYTQWRGSSEECIEPGHSDPEMDHLDCRVLTEQSLQKVSSSSSLNLTVSKSFKISHSMSNIKLDASISNLSMLAGKNYKDRDKKRDISSAGTGRGSHAVLNKSDSMVAAFMMNQDYGLFEAARLANPVLPQYHPRQLIELLNFGKIRRVKAILAHLVHCISGGTMGDTDNENQQRQRTLTRGMTMAMSGGKDGMTIPEESSPDYIEITSIPPLPLYALIAADNDLSFTSVEPGKSAATPATDDQGYDDLFDIDSQNVDDADDPFDSDEFGTPTPKLGERKRSIGQHLHSKYAFGPVQSRMLASQLTHTHLPGLSSLDQMYLLALADTMANTKLDFSDKNTPDVSHKPVSDHGAAVPVSTETIDDCGLRFMLAARHHIYLLNTLAIRQRITLQMEGLRPAHYVWAFHSEATEELLNLLPNMQKGEPTWSEMKQFGCGWWLKNVTLLRKSVEKLAKAAFKVRKDPLDAALFYLAMKKKTLLWGLFRSVEDTKMMTFFKNNFSEDRWRRAALKNAYALLGRQRFQHAAAFFLLGGAIKDAIEICLKQMDDMQLAIVITRLYESELDDTMPLNLKRILYEECLGCDMNGHNYDPTKAHPDPFIRSMAYWLINDYSAALGTLLETNIGSSRREESADKEMESYSANPSVFNFYNYLRTHPLLVRQHLAKSAADKGRSLFLSGFSKMNLPKAGDKSITYVDRITPIERRLYFTTAHAHFKSGCPALALEVLSKVPDVIDTESDITQSHSVESVTPKSPKDFGTLDPSTPSQQRANDVDWSKPVTNNVPNNTADGFDWSQPLATQKADEFDWSKPVSDTLINSANDLDWSQPVSTLMYDNDKLDSEGVKDDKPNSDVESGEKVAEQDEAVCSESQKSHGDIMAHQLKFIACLKIMMEELSTLATGFEVDGGQLRFQLYIWLEKEVEVLKQICNYGSNIRDPTQPTSAAAAEPAKSDATTDQPAGTVSEHPGSKPTLHEIILAEKLDFEAKLHRMAKRKKWLKQNQQLLRTLLGYSILHGSSGGGLASVRMELMLLLQELQQEKTQQQLLSPLPFPTTLPLVSATIASSKTVIADPIRHLQSFVQDILHTVVDMRNAPEAGHKLNRVFALRNLSVALSACIYQCLCDSDSFVVQLSDHIDVGMEGFTSTNVVYTDSYLMAGAQRKHHISSSADEAPNSAPNKWPGVSSLRALLARNHDDDAPKLTILLCEALVAVYMSLLIHALTMYDANLLYRLVNHPFTESLWPLLFGGGLKKVVNVLQTQPDIQTKIAQTPKDDVSKQRMKLHMKVLGPSGSSQHLKEHKPTYKERFVPPQLSMISYFMAKPHVDFGDGGIQYDSEDSISSDEEDEDDEYTNQVNRSELGQMEHLDPNSYSWCLMRYAIVKYVRYTMVQFLPQIGIELPELPQCSPLVQAVLNTLEHWEGELKMKLELFNGPPDDYIPGCYPDSMTNGPTITKYKPMLEPINTPFLTSHYSALPAKRLWHYLVHQRYLQEVFIRYIFKKRRPLLEDENQNMKKDTTDGVAPSCQEPVKVMHKDLDMITAFCLNQANLNSIAIATQKEIIEMDISGVLYPPVWLEDETEYDIENIRLPSPSRLEPEEFLVVSTPADKNISGSGTGTGSGSVPSAPGAVPAPSGLQMSQSGRGGSVLAKRTSHGVRRMGSHPHLPYYLTGSQDGSVRLWEWGHSQCISVARQSGAFPKVNKVLFNAQGNKFGVADGEGSVCLWQVGLGVNMNKPYYSLKCHNKMASDFVFVGSSSLLATAGHSSESRNVCLWDTLLPQKNALIQAFQCHHDGCPAMVYAPQHQTLITSGKKGDICIFDIRQRQLRQTFQAHESAVKTIALDPMEEYFVTGSVDGDIKIWGLTVHNLVYSFPGEHCKGSIFQSTGTGVTQVYLSPQNHLFSCGADGSVKVRRLPQRELIVHSLTSSTLSST